MHQSVSRALADLPSNVPADTAVSVREPFPRIDNLPVDDQRKVILRNADVAMMGGPDCSLLFDHEFENLKEFLEQIQLDSHRASARGSEPFWRQAYYAIWAAVVRCLRLRAAGIRHDLNMSLCNIQCYFSK